MTYHRPKTYDLFAHRFFLVVKNYLLILSFTSCDFLLSYNQSISLLNVSLDKSIWLETSGRLFDENNNNNNN